jgi:hypothetical protein
LYEVGGCAKSFSHAHPSNFLGMVCFHLGTEQCSKMFGQISPRSYYYLKDLKIVNYNCHGLPYGKENQTLLIDDELGKALQNPKWSGCFFNNSWDKCCQIKRCNG